MIRYLNVFAHDEDGAVTVDWVVLCAAIVGLSIAVMTAMQTGALNMTDNVDTYLDNQFFSGE